MDQMLLISIAAILMVAFGQAATLGAISVGVLRCENRDNPLGVDVALPRLSWQVASTDRGERQTAYQVLVASSKEPLSQDQGDLWDSGAVRSDQTICIRYAGKNLSSHQQIFWKARAWDASGRASNWSEISTWTMGVLNDPDWTAKWIAAPEGKTAPTLVMRREFAVRPGLRRAVLHICGLGQHEISINGVKVGENLLSPGWTNYRKTCLYETFDITESLKPGANAAGILLGNGMYNVTGGRYAKFKGSFGELKAIAQIRLEYVDGSSETIGTDEQWKVYAGPITFSCVFGGEDYDARLEQRGWDSPGFHDSSWSLAGVVDGPGGKLRGLSSSAPPIRVLDVCKPVATNELRPGIRVYDVGQNASIMLRMWVKGSAGAVVRIIPAELLKDDGSVDRTSVGRKDAWWQYTLSGEGEETYFAKFFYHGCRYLQAEITGDATVESIEGVVVHAAAEPVGEFECSNDLFNRIRTLIRWAQRSNMFSVLTDCPHRERLGWLEQTYLNGPSLRYEFDLTCLIEKAMNDMADSQRENGLVPDIAPEYTVFPEGFLDSPEWGSAIIQCAWQQYEWSGDTGLLSRYYDNMKRYVEYLRNTTNDQGLVTHGLGDWYDIGPKPPSLAQLTPIALTATAIYYEDLRILANVARLLEKPQDCAEFEQLAQKARDDFNRAFFDPTKASYSTNSQCANAMPYALAMVDEAHKASVLEAIVKDVRDRGNALTAGDVGYRYLLRALAAGDRSDVVFDMNNQSDRPGYGYQLKEGATALTEAWNARRSSSHNHFMLGHLMEWFYHDLAGIQPDPAAPGFKKVIIKPALVGDINWVKASYNSVRGKFKCEWKREGDRLALSITVPANTSATVYVPTSDPNSVRVDAPNVRLLKSDSSQAVYEIESGSYVFDASIKK